MNETFHHVARGILIKENKLFVSRAKGYPNMLFLPGGHVEFGESAKDALEREMQEEIGAKCAVNQFLGVIEHKWETDGVTNVEINHLFKVESEALHPGLKLASKEAHLEFFWCEITDLEKENLQPKPVCRLVQHFVNGSESVWWASALTHSK